MSEYVSRGRKPKYDWSKFKHIGDSVRYPKMTKGQSRSIRVLGEREHGLRLSVKELKTGGYHVVVVALIEKAL